VSLLGSPWRERAAGALLGAVFIYASLDKIAHPAEFARIVYHYRLVGPSATLPPLVPNLIAVTLPWIELVTGALLLLGPWRREAASIAALLLGVFICSVGVALLRGIDLENCGCFTVTGQGRQAGLQLIVGDLALLVIALALASRAAVDNDRKARLASGPR
jgi:uncharacterized membrane protein YphA (DoxX/SURF4 family)